MGGPPLDHQSDPKFLALGRKKRPPPLGVMSPGAKAHSPAPALSSLALPPDPPVAAELATFERAYRAHFPFTWRSLRRLGVPESDLPDAVQDVFLVVHRKLAAFDGQARLTTWIYAICLRVASDRRRRASTRYEVLGEARETASAASSSDSLELAERRALLERGLDSMPLEQRAVFTLFELEGMTGTEIAELLDVPVPTVHSRLRLAREAFRGVVERARSRDPFDRRRIGEDEP
jgi:RNA polymerase sigma-70 factor, ECF subfamily